MLSNDRSRPALAVYRRLVQRVVEGEIPRGEDFDACRAVLVSQPSSDAAFTAVCVLLEGALADPAFDIDATQSLVPLLRQLASGAVAPEDLL